MRDDKLYQKIQEMRCELGWDKTDTDERLAKFTVMEAAELLECYLDEEVSQLAVQEEIADILMYVLSICIDNGWDYEELIYRKMLKVKEKYTIHE